MKAIVFDRYGSTDVLELRDVPVPEVAHDGVLVRVRAAAVNPYDWHLMSGLPHFVRLQLGLRRPRVHGIGADLAGTVEAVGPDVTRFAPGDEVFGRVDLLPGGGLMDLGAAAEYVRVSQDRIRPRPGRLSAEEAAAIPLAGVTALWAMQDVGAVQPGQRVLINGASGGVGTFAVQIAKAMGAEVTGVCSTRNVELVRSLGADHVIDYTREELTRDRSRYDLLLDNVGNRSPADSLGVLRPGGLYLASFDHPDRRSLGPLTHIARLQVRARLAGRRVAMLQPEQRDADLDTLGRLVADGAVTPVLDRSFPLVDTAAAIDHLAGRHARGKIVVTP